MPIFVAQQFVSFISQIKLKNGLALVSIGTTSATNNNSIGNIFVIINSTIFRSGIDHY
jgi:hypothetical protein